MLTKGGSVPDCVDTGLSHPGGCTYTYDPATLQLATETTPVGLTAATRTLTRSYDALLRPTGYELKNGSTVETSAAQTYDAAGRMATVVHQPHSVTPRTFTYGYTAGRPHLLASVTGPVHTVSKTWESQRDVLSQVSNEIAGSPVSRYTYTVNALGQRTAVATTGSAFGGSPADWTWGYNAKGEVTSATHGSTAGRSLAWTFDDIGNRLTQSVGTVPANTSYTTNLLNQYTTIGHPTPSTETPVHDLDGNLIQDDTKKYVWDAENRLKEVLRASDNALIASYQYDHLGRRVRKTTTTLAPQNATDSAYVYDGWNVVVEYVMAGGLNFVSRTRTWGLDLSGSLQGAGGVGGLLADGDAIGGLWYATYDGNGNVSDYLSKTGMTSAHYEYDAFGNTVFGSGVLGAPLFSCRFSTKPLDAETGWYYYGYRYYDAVKGRWSSRDPIEEEGGVNLYGMVGNDAVNRADLHGLTDAKEWRKLLEDDTVKKTIKEFGISGSIAALAKTRYSKSEKPDPRGKDRHQNYEGALVDFFGDQHEWGGRICLKCDGEGYLAELVEGDGGQVYPMMMPKCSEGDLNVGWVHSHPNLTHMSTNDKNTIANLKQSNAIDHGVNIGYVFVAFEKNYPWKVKPAYAKIDPGKHAASYVSVTVEVSVGGPEIIVANDYPFLFPEY